MTAPPRLLIDAHLDLGLSAVVMRRDVLREVDDIRRREGTVATPDPEHPGGLVYSGGLGDDPGPCTTTLPDLRRAGCAVALFTLLARCRPWLKPRIGMVHGIDYPTPEMAQAHAMSELAYYDHLVEIGQARYLRAAADLDACLADYRADPAHAPIGFLVTMEGADPIVEPAHLERWHDRGLRGLSLAHYGHSRYAGGTPDPRHFPDMAISTIPPLGGEDDGPDPHASDMPLTDAGRALVDEINRLHALGKTVALDLTHTSDCSLAEALERAAGPVYMSHSNCRAITGSVRENTDEQLKAVIARGGVIGAVLHSGMIAPADAASSAPGSPGAGPPAHVPLARLIDHIARVCDLAGNAEHAAIGSDMDGGFGADKVPTEIDRYADMTKIADALADRGFDDGQIDAVFHANWHRFWHATLAPGT